MFITPQRLLWSLRPWQWQLNGWTYFLLQFLLKPGNPVFNDFRRFGAVATAGQVVSQLIIAEYVANPVAEVIPKRRYMMVIRIIGHIAQAISQLLQVTGYTAVVAKEAFVSTDIG
jgi:hypothetical protein